VTESSPVDLKALTIAVLGGTGPQGRGLARRFAQAGLTVVIGSRGHDKGEATGAELAAATGGAITGTDNLSAATAGDVVLVVVPWEGHGDLIASLAPALAGKIAAGLLPESTVVGAFHNVSAALLEDPSVERIETDVLVLGDEREATDLVQALADTIPGMRGVYGGRRRNAHQVEALTANLISVNRRYKAHAGVRVTDV
jgi:predicted dinucleotide-binding enzyme